MAPYYRRDSRSQGVNSVSKALELLSCFSTEQPEWGVSELAEHLGLCKSAVHRILVTCEDYRFVSRTGRRRYRLGNRALELGNVCRLDRTLLSKAEPALRQVAQLTNSVAHLGQIDGREVLEVMRSAMPGARIFTPSPKLRGPLHATAMGKVLLAFGGHDAFTEFVGPYRNFTRYTPYTISTPEALRKELEVVVSQGYAVSNQERVLGCCCVAVPVRNRLRQTVAAISLSNSPERFSEAELPIVLTNLIDSAEAIGREVFE